MARFSILVLFLLLFSEVAFGSNFGPASLHVEPGQFYLSGGYQHYAGDWEEDDNTGIFEDMELRQHRAYLQGGIGLFPGWEFHIRGGLANLEAEDAYRIHRESDFKASLRPFVGGGLKGRLYKGENLTIGLFADGDYYSSYEDQEIGTGEFVGTFVTEKIDEKLAFDKIWMANAGIVFQGELEGAVLYGGPFFFASAFEKESAARGFTTGTTDVKIRDIEEKNNAGLFMGVHWDLKKDVFLDFEIQYKSSMSIGLSLSSNY